MVRLEPELRQRRLRALTGFFALPGSCGVEPKSGGYCLRAEDNPGEMPNAEVRIQGDGLSVCDDGSGAQFLSSVMLACLAEFGEVTVSKLDWE